MCEALIDLPMHKFLAAVCVTLALATLQPAWAQADAAGATPAEQCVACHGPGGNSQNPDFPVLAGQSWRYIYIQLKDFKEGRRNDPVMSAMAAGLSRDDMIALGNYFAAIKPLPIAFKADGAKVEAAARSRMRCSARCATWGGSWARTKFPRSPGSIRST